MEGGAEGEKAPASLPPPAAPPPPEEEEEVHGADPENPHANTYELVKARFERRCFKVLSPFTYANLVGGRKEPDLYGPVTLKHLYANLYFFERDRRPNSQQEWRKELFVGRWMGDVNLRQVTAIVVDPCSTRPDVYNMWGGFAAEGLPPVPDEDVEGLVAPFIRHLDDVITRNDAAATTFMLDYLANIVQRPDRPTHVGVSIFGKQGCGKGLLFAFFREGVLGKDSTYQTAYPENDLLGRFQNGCVNRVFIQVDEVKCLRDFDDKLKNLITNGTIQYEKKGRDIITVKNYVNLLFTSNNENALAVPTDDRRFVLFRCSERYMGDGVYLKGLSQHLDRAEVKRAFYQFCMGRDLSAYPYDFQLSRPVTDYYLECQKSSIPVTSRFLSALVNGGEVPPHIGALALYQQYVLFHNAGHYKVLLTETAFGRNVRRVAGVCKVRQGRGQVYVLEADAIKAHLVENNEYDDDCSLI